MKEVPKQNIIIDCQLPHAEVLDMETGTVWQTALPISQSSYEAMVLPQSMVKLGIGVSVMDEHYFRRSPGAHEDGPVQSREIDDRLWIHCANPPTEGAEKPFDGGPLKLMVDKHHSLIFASGREVAVLCSPEGSEYIQVIAGKETTATPDLSPMPSGWKLRTHSFTRKTLLHLPAPTEAWFFRDHGSFQGPVPIF